MPKTRVNQRRKYVKMIREWLETNKRLDLEEIDRRFNAEGVYLKRPTLSYYRYQAKILLNRETVFGTDAERMFGTKKKSPRSRKKSE
jgi:hypothetical protein